MTNMLQDGFPRIKDFQKLPDNPHFLEMEKFSAEFIKRNKDLMEKYPWSKDPLHHWSRSWEYTYVFERIRAYIQKKPNRKLRVLDAGSGWSFFPYFLHHKFSKLDVSCCDSDTRMNLFYARAEKGMLSIDISDIAKTPYPDNYFDIVYCISVLEHTKNYKTIIRELKRILRPGGIFIITFDISLNNEKEIRKEEAPNWPKSLKHNLQQRRSSSQKRWMMVILSPQDISEKSGLVRFPGK